MTAENYWGQDGREGVSQPQPTQQYQPVHQWQPTQQYQPVQQYQQPQPVRQFVQPPEVTSLGGWVLNLLLVAIPIVGIVMLFVWAFGSTPDESKKNWARANLIWLLIAIVLYVILFMVMGVSFVNLYGNGSLS